MSTNIEELVETLSKLSVLEMSKLKVALEEKWGVKAQAAAAFAVAAAPVLPSTGATARNSESVDAGPLGSGASAPKLKAPRRC